MATSILRLPSVIERTGLSRSTIYDRIKEGTFPAPIKIGPRMVGWTDESIQEWIDNQVQKRLW